MHLLLAPAFASAVFPLAPKAGAILRDKTQSNNIADARVPSLFHNSASSAVALR